MTQFKHDEAISRVIDSAARLGVELDAVEAQRWVESMAVEVTGGDGVPPPASMKTGLLSLN